MRLAKADCRWIISTGKRSNRSPGGHTKCRSMGYTLPRNQQRTKPRKQFPGFPPGISPNVLSMLKGDWGHAENLSVQIVSEGDASRRIHGIGKRSRKDRHLSVLQNEKQVDVAARG